jgi:catalase
VVDNEQTLTNAAGIPLASNTVSKTVGKQGPLLLEDYTLLEKMAHFNRERIPERVVHAICADFHSNSIPKAIATTEPPKPQPKPATV